MKKCVLTIFCLFIFSTPAVFSQTLQATSSPKKGKIIRDCNFPENESSQLAMSKKKNELNAINKADTNADIKRMQKIQEILDIDKTLKCTQTITDSSTESQNNSSLKEMHYEIK
jgi:hypothetical protein